MPRDPIKEHLKKIQAHVNARELTQNCPKCGHEFQITVARMKSHPEFVCPDCGDPIRFKVVDPLDRA